MRNVERLLTRALRSSLRCRILRCAHCLKGQRANARTVKRATRESLYQIQSVTRAIPPHKTAPLVELERPVLIADQPVTIGFGNAQVAPQSERGSGIRRASSDLARFASTLDQQLLLWG